MAKKDKVKPKDPQEKSSKWYEYSEKEIKEMGPIYPVGNEATVLHWEDQKRELKKIKDNEKALDKSRLGPIHK